MATAKTIFRTKPDIQLTMNAQEADALAVVLSVVGGEPNRSARRYIDGIIEALQLVDVDYRNDFNDFVKGHITFMPEVIE